MKPFVYNHLQDRIKLARNIDLTRLYIYICMVNIHISNIVGVMVHVWCLEMAQHVDLNDPIDFMKIEHVAPRDLKIL